jgi:bacteriocin biosynthesis cyclodehydratase domain-containing protein
MQDDRMPRVGGQRQLIAGEGAPPQGGAARWCLRASIELFFASDGDVYLLRGGAATEHVVRRPNAFERQLLRGLTRGGVDAAPGSREHASLNPLIAVGAVVPEPKVELLDRVDAERFARQLPYLADFGDPVAAQRRLRACSVVILGCGGLGTWALGALAGAGIGRFVLIDDDDVELSNLNRQVLYRAADIGMPKVDVAARWLTAFDPAVEVDARRERVGRSDDARRLLSGADALLLTADWPPYDLNRWINDACLAEGVPFISAGQQPPLLRIGPTHIPGRGACHACHEEQLRRGYPLYGELAEQRRRHPPAAMTLGAASGVIGTLMALEVLHLLLGHPRLATHDRVLLFDIRTMHLRCEVIEQDPRCPRCAGLDGARH